MDLIIHAVVISPDGLRDPGPAGALDSNGQLQVLPFEFWQQFTQADIAVFCHKHAVYCIPTIELIDWLNKLKGDRSAIEIGAGAGTLSAALNIQATDNHMQAWPDVAAEYRKARQPTIAYGARVHKLDAAVALARHRPEMVIAAWVTHKWNPRELWREGNEYGVDERKVIRQADYVFIGHEYVHRHKPILDLPHETHFCPWLVSRATSQGRNYIKIWRRQK